MKAQVSEHGITIELSGEEALLVMAGLDEDITSDDGYDTLSDLLYALRDAMEAGS